MPNAWDAGSAKYLAACGFAALGTTSAGIAFAAGHRDSDPRQSVDAMFAAIASIVAAVPIPVSADLEAGFGDSLDDVQRTFTRAIAIGCAGGSLEDVADYATPGQFVLRSRQDAIERVCAARAAIDQHATPFVLTARTECFLTGHPSPLAEAIDRLCAFRDAGADCLFAPGISQPADIATLVREVNAPLNVLTAGPAAQLTLAQLRDLGVRRISTGSALAEARRQLAGQRRLGPQRQRMGGARVERAREAARQLVLAGRRQERHEQVVAAWARRRAHRKRRSRWRTSSSSEVSYCWCGV